MKNKIISSFIFGISALILMSGCHKKADVLQTNFISVNLLPSGSKFVTDSITVNPKDSIFFDFSISSSKNMQYVFITKNTNEISRDTLKVAPKTTFSAVKKFAADSIPGVYTYRIFAKDTAGIFLGDKNITVTVTSDFTYYTLRILQAPDSTEKTNKCYFSASTGKSYSYSEGAANSASIDFGYYYDTTAANKHTIYALTSIQPQLNFYDVGTWTKNATIFKKITSTTFAAVTSKGALRTAGIVNLASGTSSKITTTTTGTAAKTNLTGDIILFKTAAGKYGIMTVNYTNQDSPNATTFINMDVKIEN